MNKLLLLVILASTISLSTSTYNITQWGIPNWENNKGYHMEFYVPTEAGTYPVMPFLTGFGSITPAKMYNDLLGKMAAEGVIVVGLMHFQTSVNYSEKAYNLDLAVTWLEHNIRKQLASHDLTDVVGDMDNQFILGCQSAGCHTTGVYLNTSCNNVKANLMIDPVDGADPWGLINETVIIEGQPLPFKIPTLIECAGKDYDHYKFEPACAPKKFSCEHWYQHLDGPTWYANFTNYGHLDCLNEYWADIGAKVCPYCDASSCDTSVYHTELNTMFSNFIQGALYKNPSGWDVVENFEGITLDHSGYHKYNGYNKDTMGGFCTHFVPEEEIIS